MFVNTVCRSLQKLVINNYYSGAVRCYTQVSKNVEKIAPVIFQSGAFEPSQSTSRSDVTINFSPRSLNVDIDLPIRNNIIKDIIDMPLSNIRYEDRIPNSISRVDLPVLENVMDLPTNERVIEKQAHRMLKIRKKKMKKHQRKKLRKKMKFFWAKIRHRRQVRKEKLFQIEQTQKVIQAQNFNAEEYVKEKLKIVNSKRLPITYEGDVLPSYMIKRLIKEKEAKKNIRKFIPRLTL